MRFGRDERISVDGDGIGKLIAPLALRGARTDVPKVLERLKQRLEADG